MSRNNLVALAVAAGVVYWFAFRKPGGAGSAAASNYIPPMDDIPADNQGYSDF